MSKKKVNAATGKISRDDRRGKEGAPPVKEDAAPTTNPREERQGGDVDFGAFVTALTLANNELAQCKFDSERIHRENQRLRTDLVCKTRELSLTIGQWDGERNALLSQLECVQGQLDRVEAVLVVLSSIVRNLVGERDELRQVVLSRYRRGPAGLLRRLAAPKAIPEDSLLLDYEGFDPDKYLLDNEDLAEVGVSPVRHFATNGAVERRWSALVYEQCRSDVSLPGLGHEGE